MPVGIGASDIPIHGKTADALRHVRGWLKRCGYADWILAGLAKVGEGHMVPGLCARDTVIVIFVDHNSSEGEAFVLYDGGTVLVRRLTSKAGEWRRSSFNAGQRCFRCKRYAGVECEIIGHAGYRLSEKLPQFELLPSF